MGGRGSGGRRRGAQRAPLDPCAPPSAPRDLSPAERAVWRELAEQVTLARTFNASRSSAFRLAVKAVALAYNAPPGTKAGTLHGLIRTASAMLARFGLDALAVNAADAAPPPPDEKDRDLAALIDGSRPSQDGKPAPTLRSRADRLRREQSNPN